MSIGFLGLGKLGMPLAENLLAAGEPLVVWNRTTSKAEELAKKGATVAASPREAVRPVTFSILWDDASVLDTVQSEGFLDALRGGIHVGMSTIAPTTAKQLAALHARHGSTYVEAPIFGVPPQVAARSLIFNLAGPVDAKARVRPYLEAMGGQHVVDFGDIGGGTATKLAGNFMLITAMTAMNEAFEVLTKAGIDPKPAFDMLTSTILATPGLKRTAAVLTAGQTPPASAIAHKDIGLFRELASSATQSTPLADRVADIWDRR